MLGHVIVIHETTNRVKRKILGQKIFNSLVIQKPLNPEQGCKSLLSVGGDNLQFYPNFALFSTLGGINLDHDSFQVNKLSAEQKKKIFTKTGTLFFPEFKWIPTLRYTPESNYWRGCRCRPYSNYFEDTVNLLGGYIPPIPPGFGHP